MIYKVISLWISAKIAYLNSLLADGEKIKLCELNFENDFLPANMSDSSYLLKLRSVSFNDDESGSITVNAFAEFHFRLYKKPVEYYRMLIDDRLFRLSRLLSDDTISGLEYTSDGITISNIHNIKITGLDKAYKGGEFLTPKIEFELQVFEN